MASTRPKCLAVDGRPPAESPRAFTLVEVMVVILILGILLALVVGVGKTVMKEVGRTKTKQIQDIVVAAIRAYYEVKGFYPAEAISDATTIPGGQPTDPLNDATIYYGTTGWWSGITGPFRQENMAAKIRNASLYDQLMAEPASVNKMQSLPPEAVFTTTKTIWTPPGLAQIGKKLIRDGYDNDMDYRAGGGMGGKPVLISTGPDAYFYRDNSGPGGSQKDYDVDNIRSDGYGR